jgi:hypothetical protein
LGTLATGVLRLAVVMAIVDGVIAVLTPKRCDRENKQDRAELPAIDREIGRLTEAIAAGGNSRRRSRH